MNIVIKFDIFSECKFGLQAAQQFIFKPSHYSQPLGRGEIPHSARGLTQTDAGNKESSTCGVGGWVVGGGIRLYGKGYLPTERTGKEHYVCVRGCTWSVRAQTRIFTNMHEGTAFPWFLHSWHSFLRISSHCEAHCSRALTSRGGFHVLPPALSLTNPPIFGSERKGIPDDDSKAPAAKGNSLHICFLCVCVSIINARQCVHYLLELKGEFSSVGNSKC